MINAKKHKQHDEGGTLHLYPVAGALEPTTQAVTTRNNREEKQRRQQGEATGEAGKKGASYKVHEAEGGDYMLDENEAVSRGFKPSVGASSPTDRTSTLIDGNEAIRRGFKPSVGATNTLTLNEDSRPSEENNQSRYRQVIPGAVAVPGVDESGFTYEEAEEDPRVIQAYPVAAEDQQDPQGPGPLVHATLLDRLDDKKRLAIVGILAVLTIAAAIGIGLGVGRANNKGDDSSTQVVTDPELGELLVSFIWTLESYGQIHEGRKWRKIVNGEEVRTTNGNALDFRCHPIACDQGTGHCLSDNITPYEEGCCLGPECPEETKCGDMCPPGVCTPNFAGCVSEECFTCKKSTNGEELYRVVPKIANVFCIDYGTSTTSNGDSYNWVAYCSEIVRGGESEDDISRNFGNGEYQCLALRKGEAIKEYAAFMHPCQYLQLGECGCGPLDMNPFGLPPPAKPCQTEADCRLLCSDASVEESYDLCRAFGGIEFWEGNNFGNANLFYDPVVVIGDIYANNTVFEIDMFAY